MPKLSIILPVHNTPTWLELCLEAINASSIRSDIEVIVVQNTSNPRINDILNKSNVDKVLSMPMNLGVPASYNDGALAATSDKLCFLHTDTILTANVLERMLNYLEEVQRESPYVVGCIPVTNYADETVLRISDQATNDYVNLKPTNKSTPSKQSIVDLLTRYYDNGRTGMDALNYYASRISEENDGIYAALTQISHYCLLIERDVFISLGMFDTDFFPISYFEKLFHEKLYLKSGYEIHLCRDTYVHHNGNTTSDFHGSDYPSILKRNSELYHQKQIQAEEVEKEHALMIIESRKSAQLKEMGRQVVNPKIKKPIPEQVAFIRQGSLQDIIMTMPVVLDFKKSFPSCNISYIANPEHAAFLDSIEEIDRVVNVYDKPDSNNWQNIVKGNSFMVSYFDAVYDWTYCLETDESGDDPVKVFSKKYGKDVCDFPEAQVVSCPNVDREIPINGGKLIVLASSNGSSLHQWDDEKLSLFSDAIEESFDSAWNLAVVSNVDIYWQFPHNVIPFLSKLKLKEVMYLISRADVVVADDLAYYYIACVLGKPVIGLFEDGVRVSDSYFSNQREAMPFNPTTRQVSASNYRAVAEKINCFLS